MSREQLRARLRPAAIDAIGPAATVPAPASVATKKSLSLALNIAPHVDHSTHAMLGRLVLGRNEPSWRGLHMDYTTNSLPRKGRKLTFRKAAS